MGQIKYYVNEETRTVVAVFDDKYKNQEAVWKGALRHRLHNIDVGEHFVMFYNSAIWKVLSSFNGSYASIVHCHPDDKFDIETGKKLARDKLIRRFQRASELCEIEFFRQIKDKLNTMENRAYRVPKETIIGPVMFDETLALDWLKNGKNGKPVLGYYNCLTSDARAALSDETVRKNLLLHIDDIAKNGPDECLLISLVKSEYGDGWDFVIDG